MHPALGLVAKRFLVLIPLLLGVSIVAFVLLRLGGADPATLIAGPVASEDQVLQVRDELGLDEPLYVQYWDFLGDLVHGDLGTSWQTGQPVTEEIRTRMPASLELWVVGMAGAVVIGVAAGSVSALRADKATDHLLRVGTLLGLSLPVFLLGLILIYVFAVRLSWAPPPLGQVDPSVGAPNRVTGAYVPDALLTGNWPALRSSLAHLVLPALTLALVTGATIAAQTRSALIEILQSPLIHYQRACGASKWRVYRTALKNALPGIATYFAIAATLALGGAALTEQVFSWGGFSQFALDAVVNVDFAVVQAYILLIGLVTVIVYLLADLLTVMIDPRVRIR